MPWQLSCHGMCKISWWSLDKNVIESKEMFTSNFITMEKICWFNGSLIIQRQTVELWVPGVSVWGKNDCEIWGLDRMHVFEYRTLWHWLHVCVWVEHIVVFPEVYWARVISHSVVYCSPHVVAWGCILSTRSPTEISKDIIGSKYRP